MWIAPEILAQWRISDADKAALADLPETVPPFFHADPQRDFRPMMRGGLYRIGNDLGLEIGVGSHGVRAVDPLGVIPDCFVNSSVADLAEFLRETGTFQARVANMDEDDAVTQVIEMRNRLRQRDAAAFGSEHSWWSAVFSELESGQY